jgi:prevent-host-death family protein
MLHSKLQVKPITYMKHRTAELVQLVSEEQQTITITQNGEAKVVVMDIVTYQRWQQTMALLQIVALGERDIAGGNTASQNQAFDRAFAAIKAVREK